MRRVNVLRVVLLLAVVLLPLGCASSNKGKIEGTKWSSQAATIKGKTLPAGSLQLDFGKDGSLVYLAGPLTLKGTYSLGSGNYVTMNFEQELAGRKSHVQQVAIDGDHLTMTDSDGTQMTFDKQK
jgi:hypothetical protein